MKYPKINKKQLDEINQCRFDALLETIEQSINFDREQNQLKITDSDVGLLSWNIATNIISQPY